MVMCYMIRKIFYFVESFLYFLQNKKECTACNKEFVAVRLASARKKCVAFSVQ